MATKPGKSTKRKKAKLRFDLTLSSDDDHASIQHQPGNGQNKSKTKTSKGRDKKKNKMRNLFDDFSCSDNEIVPDFQVPIEHQDVKSLDDILSQVKAKQESRIALNSESVVSSNCSSHTSNISSDVSKASSDLQNGNNTGLSDLLDGVLSKAKAKKGWKGKVKSVKNIKGERCKEKHRQMKKHPVVDEAAALAAQLDNLLITATRSKNARQKNNPRMKNKASGGVNKEGKKEISKENAFKSPSRTLLQTFVMDSDSEKEIENSSVHSECLVHDSSLSDTETNKPKIDLVADVKSTNDEVMVVQDSFNEDVTASHQNEQNGIKLPSTIGSDSNENISVHKEISLQVSFASFRVSSDNESCDDNANTNSVHVTANPNNLNKHSEDVSLQASFDGSSSLDNQGVNDISLQASFQSSYSEKDPSVNDKSLNTTSDYQKESHEQSKHNISLQASFSSPDKSEDAEDESNRNIENSAEKSESCGEQNHEDSQRNVSLQASFDSSEDEQDMPSKAHRVKNSDPNKNQSNQFEDSHEQSQCDISLQASFTDSESNSENNTMTKPNIKNVDSDKRGKSGRANPNHQDEGIGKKCARMVSLSDSSDDDLGAVVKPRIRKVRQKPKNSGSDDDIPQGTRKWRARKLSESDSEEGDLDAFLAKMKQPTKQFVASPARSKDSGTDDSLDDFIVPDDEISSEESPGFYLKKDRKLRERVNTRTYRDAASDSESETEEERSSDSQYSRDDSDSSDLEIERDAIVTKTTRATRSKTAPNEASTHETGTEIGKQFKNNRPVKSNTEEDSFLSSDSEQESDSDQPPVKTDRSVKPNSKNASSCAISLSSDSEIEITVGKENASRGKSRSHTLSSDDSFELPDLETKLTKKRLNSTRNTTLFTGSDEDFTTDSVFKTPKNVLVRPKISLTTPRDQPPAALGLSVPPRRPLSLLQSRDERPASAEALSSCSFLKSLGEDVAAYRRHHDAARYVKNFKKLKEELTQKLYSMYNETIFDSKLPVNLEIKWNVRLTKTAGFFAHKKRPKDGDRSVGSRIELSVKVCDRAERLRDTLLHEMCHAAVWILHGVREGHGRYWKHFARKANRTYPELAVVERCHNYQIMCKYTYKCTSCGYEIGRHSKSLDTEQKVCGYCRAPFTLLVATPAQRSANSSAGSLSSLPATPRTPNRFALFVKEHYGNVKKAGALSHKDVMQQLSKDFAAKNKLS